jgi:high-affinity iron transporter
LKTKSIFAIIIALLLPFFLAADNIKDQVRTLINISDYIANDYVNAVEDNAVIDEFEYDEMLEFSANLLEIYENVKSSIDNPEFSLLPALIEELQTAIEQMADNKIVKQKAERIKKVLLSLNIVETAPAIWPSLAEGKKLYAINCAACHGEKGLGDGVLSKGMIPEPTDFTEADHLSPFHIFNTIHLGIEGTSMAAMPHLSDEEKWDIAFYVQSLTLTDFKDKHNKIFFREASQFAGLAEIALLNNDELQELFPEKNKEYLLALRFHQPENQLAEAINLTKLLLSNAVEKYLEGDFKTAGNLALQAYFEGFEPVERKIIATNAATVRNVEAEMLAFRSALSKENQGAEVEERYNRLIALLDSIDTEEEESGGFWFALLATISILIREGLEALLIIVAILSALRAMGAEQAKKYVHAGWLSAVLIGIAGYFFTARLIAMGAQSRELIEGIGALIAVVVLLSVGFWLHDKSNAARWNQYIRGKIQKHLSSGSNIAIGLLAFVVVFREAFESVIFLSALTVGGDSASKNGVLAGSLISLIFILILAVLIVRFSKKLPVHHVFKISSIAMIVLAVILAGKGMKELQEAGIFSVNLAPFNFNIEFLGIFPTWEGIGLQLFVLLISLGMIAYNKSKINKAG